ncbi:MAG: hypothetical protein U1E50_14060 [Caulobacteraceae bacterium]
METKTYRVKPWPMLIVAALLAVIATCAIVFGDYGSAPEPHAGIKGAVGALLDKAPPWVIQVLAYGLQGCFLLLAAVMVWRAVSPSPILVLTGDQVTLYSVFGGKTMRWEDVRGVTYGGAGLVTLKSDLASVTISVNAIRADPQEIYGEVDRRLRAHGYPGP